MRNEGPGTGNFLHGRPEGVVWGSLGDLRSLMQAVPSFREHQCKDYPTLCAKVQILISPGPENQHLKEGLGPTCSMLIVAKLDQESGIKLSKS